MTPQRRRAIFRRLAAANPQPATELEHSTPFELLVAVVLSAHTTDRSVNAATRKLFPIANTPQALAALGQDGVRPYLMSVGLYNAKARNIVELSRRILSEHAGQVPRDRAALEALPGVGRKTANVILNIVHGEETIAVDTHIFRVANRTGLAPGKNPRVVEEGLLASTPRPYRKNAHHWLLLHGRYVCTARRPACPGCVIADLCEYAHKTPPPTLPCPSSPDRAAVSSAAPTSKRGANTASAGRSSHSKPRSRKSSPRTRNTSPGSSPARK